MMIASTGEFERSEVQVLGQFDEEMVRVAFEEFGIGVVAQPQNQLSQIGRDDREGQIGYNRHGGLACAKGWWRAPQSLHILRPPASFHEFMWLNSATLSISD
jgi:hypothetical protein